MSRPDPVSGSTNHRSRLEPTPRMGRTTDWHRVGSSDSDVQPKRRSPTTGMEKTSQPPSWKYAGLVGGAVEPWKSEPRSGVASPPGPAIAWPAMTAPARAPAIVPHRFMQARGYQEQALRDPSSTRRKREGAGAFSGPRCCRLTRKPPTLRGISGPPYFNRQTGAMAHAPGFRSCFALAEACRRDKMAFRERELAEHASSAWRCLLMLRYVCGPYGTRLGLEPGGRNQAVGELTMNA